MGKTTVDDGEDGVEERITGINNRLKCSSR